jgi:hypothetical protein
MPSARLVGGKKCQKIKFFEVDEDLGMQKLRAFLLAATRLGGCHQHNNHTGPFLLVPNILADKINTRENATENGRIGNISPDAAAPKLHFTALHLAPHLNTNHPCPKTWHHTF